jgi:diguanylate cyclase
MNNSLSDMTEIHWLMDMLQSVDVGLIVLDNDAKVHLWNSFIENHSGITSSSSRNQSIFSLFPKLDERWLRSALESVRLLKSRIYSSWENTPFLFEFESYRPITGSAPYMYQNVTVMPLSSTSGEVNHVCLLVYDATDMAVSQIELHRSNKQLERLSQIDGLTSLYNRSTWEGHLEREFKRCRRYERDAVVVMFDIDHFKNINDTYGHQAGDEAIRRLSVTLRHQVRETDIAGRYGGEEFAVLLIDTPGEKGYVFCERLRKAIAEISIEWEGQQISYTVSLGYAELSAAQSSGLEWLKNSDEALYYSKEHGRNQTTLYT